MGFGGGSGCNGQQRKSQSKTKMKSPHKVDREMERCAAILEDEGVVWVPSVLSLDLTKRLQKCVQEELECMREAIRQHPEKSVSLFYVPAKLHFASSRGYALLPFRETASLDTSPNDKSGNDDETRNKSSSTLVESTQALLSPGTIMSQLFGTICDSELHDFCVLRTEPGAAGQVIHSDTPCQVIPGLFCAFIALQDITFDMGGTLFLPGTQEELHSQREAFDAGGASMDNMLAHANAKYVLLKAGDAAVFDMRILHAGLPNRIVGGANRFILAVTFRNL